MFGVKFWQFFLIDVLLTLAVIKQAEFLICNSSGKFQNDFGDQDLILATVCKAKSTVYFLIKEPRPVDLGL
jgi:hypothetical protein